MLYTRVDKKIGCKRARAVAKRKEVEAFAQIRIYVRTTNGTELEKKKKKGRFCFGCVAVNWRINVGGGGAKRKRNCEENTPRREQYGGIYET